MRKEAIMARKLKLLDLKLLDLKQHTIDTHEGASAYDYRATQPLTHLTFTFGSALFTDGFYSTEQDQVRQLAQALVTAADVEPKFPWQYGAWMRDPQRGKGNRVQGSLVPALLSSLLKPSEHTEDYVARCLSHRPDDVTAFLTHFKQLNLGAVPSAARRGMARALATFDEYQLSKYAASSASPRLCDATLFVRPELTALGPQGQLALRVAEYQHAPSRHKDARAQDLPLASARRDLWRRDPSFIHDPSFPEAIRAARVTWEQLLSAFGTDLSKMATADGKQRAATQNKHLWSVLLNTPGLMPDMALMRNLRNMHEAGFTLDELTQLAAKRAFSELWPHQVYAGAKICPDLMRPFSEIFTRSLDKLPPGRHLGIGDASGSMSVPVGGPMSSLSSMDVAFCLVGLMSQTSGLGASFSDATFASWSNNRFLSVAQRSPEQTALSFAFDRRLRVGMGGTQVFGAVMELIQWLRAHPEVTPPDCLWFFSDMQFHPSAGGHDKIPIDLVKLAKQHNIYDRNRPPLEMAIKLYRAAIGHVDVVLWNLAAYTPIPVPADMPGVLLVSGFDTNTFASVADWRSGTTKKSTAKNVSQSQDVILDLIRTF
jgi:hypothetical protein